VAERPRLFMKYPYPVVNYDIDDGISYGFRWRIRNFRGYGEELSISALKRRDREHSGNIRWRIPWMMGRRLQFDVGVFNFRRLDEPLYEDYIKEWNRGQVFIGIPLRKSLVHQLWATTVCSFEARDARLSIENSDGPGTLYHQNFISVGFGLQYDSRDNWLAARRGFLWRFSARRYTSVYGPEQRYIFYFIQNHLHLPIGDNGSLILTLDGDIREGDLPDFFEMELGGVQNLRGFTKDIPKGRAKLIGTIQLRRRLFGPHVFNIPHIGSFDLTINGVAFVDNGTIMQGIDSIDRAVFYTTGGVGFEILSPIQDLVRLEMAMDDLLEPVFYLTSLRRF
jgi:outer membrane protein assembly factor BamA